MNPFESASVDVSPAGLCPSGAIAAPALPPRHRLNADVRALNRWSADARRRDQLGSSNVGYEGARSDRSTRDWFTWHTSGDAALLEGWDMLTTRARDLVRNDSYAEAAVARIRQNVIGDGIQCEAEIEFDDGSLDEETNRQIDDAFRRWADSEADCAGKLSWWELQDLAYGEVPETGECFLVQAADPARNRIVPLCWQIVEAEQVDTSRDRVREGTQNKIKRGIEFDSFERPVAYYFFSDHPFDPATSAKTESVRVPASRVIHHFEVKRPSQTRGATWFAPILRPSRDMSQYLREEMTNARIANAFCIAIKRAQGAGGGLGFEAEDGIDSDDAGNPFTHIGAGIVGDIGVNDDIVQINPTRPNANAEAWIHLMLNMMSNGIGMSYLGLTGDVRGASYSSSRFSRLLDKQFWRPLQGRCGRRMILPVRHRFIQQAVALDRIPALSAQNFAKKPWHWLATNLLPPGWEEIDAPKEVAAAIERIRAGLSTLQEECAGRGRNWRRNLLQRRREMDLSAKLDLNLSIDVSSVSNPWPAPDAPEPVESAAR